MDDRQYNVAVRIFDPLGNAGNGVKKFNAGVADHCKNHQQHQHKEQRRNTRFHKSAENRKTQQQQRQTIHYIRGFPGGSGLFENAVMKVVMVTLHDAAVRNLFDIFAENSPLDRQHHVKHRQADCRQRHQQRGHGD